MFKEVADIKTSDQLHLPVPDAKFETVVAKPSEIQKEMVQELSRRAAKIHSGAVDASEDNMLCVTNDGRKIGLDVRLMNPILPDDPNSKLNTCVRNVLQIWADGKEQKLTQLLFCDLSTQLMLVLDDNHIENIFTLPRLKSFLVKARYDIGFDVAPQELEMHLQRVEKMGHIIENYCGLRLELYKELSERQ